MKYFVYGILRNYDTWDLNLIKGDVPLNGFKMYTQGGSYPFVKRTDDRDDVVYGDIIEFKSEASRKSVDGMEFNAGYHIEELTPKDLGVLDQEHVGASIYLFDKDYNVSHGTTTPIPSGDWNKKNNF